MKRKETPKKCECDVAGKSSINGVFVVLVGGVARHRQDYKILYVM